MDTSSTPKTAAGCWSAFQAPSHCCASTPRQPVPSASSACSSKAAKSPAHKRCISMGGFFSALQFLTRIPVPRGEYRLEEGVVWLPVVGLVLGAILAGVDWGLRALTFDPLVVSTLVVVLLLVLSGALHADGLMDTCDAVFGHASPERRLEIMRDPRAGTFGVVGLVCVVALKIAAVDALPTGVRLQALVLAPTLGRWAIVLLATVFPYGRASGLGAPL